MHLIHLIYEDFINDKEREKKITPAIEPTAEKNNNVMKLPFMLTFRWIYIEPNASKLPVRMRKKCFFFTKCNRSIETLVFNASQVANNS